jgi:hypothetical protein
MLNNYFFYIKRHIGSHHENFQSEDNQPVRSVSDAFNIPMSEYRDGDSFHRNHPTHGKRSLI